MLWLYPYTTASNLYVSINVTRCVHISVSLWLFNFIFLSFMVLAKTKFKQFSSCGEERFIGTNMTCQMDTMIARVMSTISDKSRREIPLVLFRKYSCTSCSGQHVRSPDRLTLSNPTTTPKVCWLIYLTIYKWLHPQNTEHLLVL